VPGRSPHGLDDHHDGGMNYHRPDHSEGPRSVEKIPLPKPDNPFAKYIQGDLGQSNFEDNRHSPRSNKGKDEPLEPYEFRKPPPLDVSDVKPPEPSKSRRDDFVKTIPKSTNLGGQISPIETKIPVQQTPKDGLRGSGLSQDPSKIGHKSIKDIDDFDDIDEIELDKGPGAKEFEELKKQLRDTVAALGNRDNEVDALIKKVQEQERIIGRLEKDNKNLYHDLDLERQRNNNLQKSSVVQSVHNDHHRILKERIYKLEQELIDLNEENKKMLDTVKAAANQQPVVQQVIIRKPGASAVESVKGSAFSQRPEDITNSEAYKTLQDKVKHLEAENKLLRENAVHKDPDTLNKAEIKALQNRVVIAEERAKAALDEYAKNLASDSQQNRAGSEINSNPKSMIKSLNLNYDYERPLNLQPPAREAMAKSQILDQLNDNNESSIPPVVKIPPVYRPHIIDEPKSQFSTGQKSQIPYQGTRELDQKLKAELLAAPDPARELFSSHYIPQGLSKHTAMTHSLQSRKFGSSSHFDGGIRPRIGDKPYSEGTYGKEYLKKVGDILQETEYIENLAHGRVIPPTSTSHLSSASRLSKSRPPSTFYQAEEPTCHFLDDFHKKMSVLTHKSHL